MIKARGSKGFMLFEAMVAAAILSTACLFLARALNAALTAGRAAEERYQESLRTDCAGWNREPSAHVPEN